ncbi:hypothetical protein FACS1894116_09060 [Betaproteobacteria bacterium]|nr:hypothetical protein FACS1894116_09060 [Betaproteobacteria bacterium]GHU24387.1 hypothetical protein FACS189488_08920 [Betaproteobacteria bacterium]
MKKISSILSVVLLLFIIFSLYAPGLTGNFIFDDSVNITDNQKIAIETLDTRALTAAFWSGDAGPLGRPISMLSFALNHYFSGFDPYFFKLTNLFIHLLTVALVFWLVHSLLRASFMARQSDANHHHTAHLPFYGAWLAAAIWGLHPLNLTSVLYVVQRMTSLATLFGLLALALYTTWRASPRHFSIVRNSLTGLVILLCLLASILSKESGLLFIPLLVWVELLIFRGLLHGHPVRIGPLTLQQLIWGGCGFGLLATFFLLPPYLTPENFYNRDFTLTERVLTESRVMFYYLRLFFLPSLSELSLYHDDFLISQSLLQPWTTLFSILGLVSITVGTWLLRRKSPLFLFAWGWFLISHALESTVFSLELIHEHRNYFATLGFLVLLPWLLSHIVPKKRPFTFVVAGAFVMLCGFITWQRAILWSNPLTHAAFEAENHSKSSRANHQLARAYLQLFDLTNDTSYVDLAKQALQKSNDSYKPGNGSWFDQIFLAYLLDETSAPSIVRQLEHRLRVNTFTNDNIQFLQTFSACQAEERCHMPHHDAVNLFSAALENPKIDNINRSKLNQIAGLYFVDTIENYEKGEELLNEALRQHADVIGHLHLAQVLRLQGKLHLAHEQLELAQELDNKNAWLREIEHELSRLARAAQVERAKISPPDAPSGSTLSP